MSFREKSPREKCPREKGLLGRNVRIARRDDIHRALQNHNNQKHRCLLENFESTKFG